MTPAEQRVIEEYQHQGFQRVVVRHDEPDFAYPIHYHHYTLALEVLSGDLMITMNHHRTHVRPGQTVSIPANAMHTVHIGREGCRYIHAEQAAK